MYFIVRQNVSSGTTLTAEGAVLPGLFRLHIRRNIGSKQDNLLALARPTGISLSQSGLVDLSNPNAGAFRASASSANKTDELMVFDNALIGRNKSAALSYYFSGGFWLKLGEPEADASGDLVFQPGSGIIIRSGTGTGEAIWTNAPNY
jgi:uncharacterized protein (TIGR02597 family)